MVCPECGYMLSAFDKECPRCVQLKGRKPAADRAEAPVAAAPITAPRPVAAEPVAPSVPAAPASQEQAYAPKIDARMLHCAVCGAAETQRLTAILNSDSWTVSTKGYQTAVATDGHGHTFMMGGPTSSSSVGRTALASRVSPPMRPILRTSWTNTFAVSVVGYSISAFLAASGSVVGPVVALVTTVLSVFAVASEANSNERAITNYRDNDVRWQAAIRAWERLFYCRRCDSLTDPITRQSAPIHEIGRLLFAPERLQELPPADSLSLLTTPHDRNQLMALAGGIGVILAIIAGILCNSQIAAHNEDIQHAGAIHAAATNKAQQAISAADAVMATAPHTTDQFGYSLVASDLDAVKSARDSLAQDLNSSEWSSEEQARNSSDHIDEEISTLQSDVVSLQQEIRAQASSGGAGATGGTDTSGGFGGSSFGTQPSAPAIEMRTKAGGGAEPGKIDLP